MQAASISVVIPARDAESTLAETLDSIAAQTLHPVEVIVVDDASRDATRALAAGHPSKPHVLAGAGLGGATAINHGVERARGEWLAFLDADDLWLPDWLESGLAAAKREAADAAVGDFESFLDPGVSAAAAARLVYPTGRRTGFLSGALLIKRSAYLAAGGMPEHLRIGYFIGFWDAFTASVGSFTLTGTLALRRRIRPGTLSFRGGSAKREFDKAMLQVARAAIKRRRGEAV